MADCCPKVRGNKFFRGLRGRFFYIDDSCNGVKGRENHVKWLFKELSRWCVCRNIPFWFSYLILLGTWGSSSDLNGLATQRYKMTHMDSDSRRRVSVYGVAMK